MKIAQTSKSKLFMSKMANDANLETIKAHKSLDSFLKKYYPPLHEEAHDKALKLYSDMSAEVAVSALAFFTEYGLKKRCVHRFFDDPVFIVLYKDAVQLGERADNSKFQEFVEGMQAAGFTPKYYEL